METQLDYYHILQVHPRAEREVIDAAYRRLASKYHPDISPLSDAGERMKQINIAYEVLSNPVKRAAYDASRGAASSPGAPPYTATRPQYSSKAWRTLLMAAGLMLLAIVALRVVPALLLLLLRVAVPLVVVSLAVWLLLTLAKPKR